MVLFCMNLQGQITQVGTATTATSVDWGSTTLTINKPSGISAGDIMIANISQATNYSPGNYVPAGTPALGGWNLIATNNDLGFEKVARGTILYKIADATDANVATSYTFTLGNNHKAAGAIIAFTGINRDIPFITKDIGTMQVTYSSNGAICPGITTSSNNALVIIFAMDWWPFCETRNFDSWATAINPNPLAENYDYNAESSPLVHVGAAWAIKENAGPTGIGTLSNTSSNCNTNDRATAAIYLALRPEKSVSITGPTSICAVSGTTTLIPTSGGTWVSNNPDVASVTDAGVVTGLAGGTASFTFTADGNAWSATTGEVTVNYSITPMVTIVSDLPGNKECDSHKVLIKFTANTSNTGGGDVSYKWYKNGRSIDGVTTNTLYDNSEIEDEDVVSCVITVTGNTSCLTSPTATSNEITTRVYPDVQPTVRIESDDADNEICDRANVSLTAIPENTNGGEVSYLWYLNGDPIGSYDNKTWYNNGESENGDRVSCKITVTNGVCFGTATATSDEVTITINPTGGTATTTTPSVCPGKTAVLTLTGYLGSIQWMYYDQATETYGDVIGGTGSTSNVYTTPPLTQSIQFFAKVSGGMCEPNLSNFVPITVNPDLPAPSVNVENICGSSILTASNYTGSLLWSTGETTASINVTVAGTYTVKQTVASCTSDAGSGIAAPKAIPEAPIAGYTGPACTYSPFTLKANGASGATYSWSGPIGFTSNLQNPEITINSPVIPGPANLTYTVTQTVNGCTSEPASITVAVYNKPSAGLFVYTARNVCEGTNYTVEIVVMGDPDGTWSSTDPAIATVDNGVVTGISPGTATISYTVTNSGGCTASQSIEITVTSFKAQITGNNGPIYSGGTAEFYLKGTPDAVLSYLINGHSDGPKQFWFNEDGNLTLAFPNVTVDQTLTLVSLSKLGGCSKSVTGTSTVTVNPLPPCTDPTIQLGTAEPACFGSYEAYLPYSSLTNCNDNSILIINWDSPEMPEVNDLLVHYLDYTKAGFLNLPLNQSLAPGTYSGTLKLQTGTCISDGYPFEITINAPISGPIASNSGPVCAGSKFTLTANGVDGAQYVWYTGWGGKFWYFETNDKNIEIQTDGSWEGDFTYEVIQIVGGCASQPATTTVTVNPNPTLTSVTASAWGVCVGSQVTFTASGLLNGLTEFNYTLTYDDNVEGTPLVSTDVTVAKEVTGGVATFTIAAPALGSYEFKITSATINGRTTNFGYNNSHDYFAAEPQPSVTIYGESSVCSGSETELIAYTQGGVGFSKIRWEYEKEKDVWEFISESEDYSTLNVSPIETTTYRAIYSAAGNGCTTAISDEFTITVIGMPTVNIASSTPDNKICYGTSVTFTATPSNTGGGSVSYRWYYGGNAYDLWGSSWTTNELEDGETVSCEITVIGGTCLTSTTAVSNTITMKIYDPNSQPSVTITSSDADNKICYGTEVTFTAIPTNTGGGTVTYKWFYIGNTYNDWGSSWTTTELDNGETVSCEITVTGGDCFPPKKATSNVIKTSVKATPAPPIIGRITQPTCSSATGSVALSGLPSPGNWILTGTGSTGTVTKTGNEPTKTITGLSAGTTYTFTVTNSAGCTSFSSGDVVINPQPMTPGAPVVGSQSFCDPATADDLPQGIGSYTYKWYSESTRGTAITGSTRLSTGNYYVSQISEGCESPRTRVNVTINALPTAFRVTGGGTYCNGGSGLTIKLSGSKTGVNYQLYLNGSPVDGAIIPGTGSALNFINQMLEGTYTVKAANASTGCEANMNDKAVISVSEIPTASSIGYDRSTSSNCKNSGSATIVLFSCTPGGKYTSAPPGLNISNSTGTINFSQSDPGTYTVTYSVSNTCGTAKTTTTVKVTKCGTKSAFITNDGSSVPDITPDAGKIIVYPNPSNGQVSFEFSTIMDGKVTIDLFNTQGKLLWNIFEGNVLAGEQRSVIFNEVLPTGTYIYRMNATDGVKTGKLIIVQ